jgi:hypothetical protein
VGCLTFLARWITSDSSAHYNSSLSGALENAVSPGYRVQCLTLISIPGPGLCCPVSMVSFTDGEENMVDLGNDN